MLPRIMISGTNSGSGKTFITCGLLRALSLRKLKVSAFKCGPDYIDPMFHTKIIGVKSKNIDTFFTDSDMTKYLFAHSAEDSDISVIEGVMGFYDGMQIASYEGSSYAISNTIEAPVVLVLDCKGRSLSIVPEIEGFLNFVDNSNIKGVILNRITKSTFEGLKELIEKRTGVKVLGYVPNSPDLVIESRHLGLITPEEVENLDEKITKFAEVLEETLDIDEIIKLAGEVSELEYNEPEIPKINEQVNVAVAKDEAFCFYYEDNLKLMKKMGANLIEFSPIKDKVIPENADCILFGGGYPEIYADKLSNNKSMLESIKSAVEDGKPCLAECGGFMYLHEKMEDMNDKVYDMAGVIKGSIYKTDKLNRFGYINIKSNTSQVFGNEGETIKGHEFHYFDSTNCGESFTATKPSGKKSWNCIHSSENLAAGFPHLYYYSNINFPYNFLKNALDRKGR